MRHMFLGKNEPKQIRRLYLGLATLGFISILGQLVIIRELLNVFQGNELVIGLVFSFWMIFTGTGSSVARFHTHKRSERFVQTLFFVSGIIPFAVVLLIHSFRFWFLPVGTHGDLTSLTIFSIALLLPACFIWGMLFTFLSSSISTLSTENAASRCYGFESAGSVIAGILFSIGLAFVLTTFQLLIIILVLNTFMYLGVYGPQRTAVFTSLIASLSFLLVLANPPDKKLRSLHSGEPIVYYKDTPYGSISISRNYNQYSLYANNTLLFSSADNVIYEEAVHFALLQRARAETVMIISGGMKGMIQQVKKYPSVKNINYVEINPWLVKAEKTFTENLPADFDLTIIDARRLIRETHGQYDAIIANTPDPSNAQLNRYYTLEFFKEAKRALKNQGVFETCLNPSVNYMSRDAVTLNSIIYNTLKKVFKNVVLIVGERNYFLASDGPLDYHIVELQKKVILKNEYVNQYYLSDDLIRQKSDQVLEQISLIKPAINKDLTPVAYFAHIASWVHQSEGDHAPMILIMISIVLICVLGFIIYRNINAISFAVLTASFAGASSEFILIMIFQVLFGYIYQLLGFILAFYMAGLAAGTLLRFRSRFEFMEKRFLVVQVLMGAMILFIPLIAFTGIEYFKIPVFIMMGSLLFLTAGIAFSSGLIYNIASRMYTENSETTASKLYSIDLAGAAAGTLITSIICFPLLGIWGSVIIIIGLLIAGIIFTLYKSS